MMQRRVLAELLLIATESLAVFMVAAALAGAARGDGPAYPFVLIAMLGGFGLVRLLLKFDTGRPALIAAAACASVLAVMIILNLGYAPERGPLSLYWLSRLLYHTNQVMRQQLWAVMGVVCVGAAWLRGAALAQREVSYTSALASYTLGLVLVVALLLFGQGAHAAPAFDAAALPYFMLGLLTLSVIHLSRAEHHHGDMLRGPWALTLAGTVAVMAAVSAAIGLLPIGLLNTALGAVANVVLTVISVVLFIIALPIAYLIYWLLKPLLGRYQQWQPPRRESTGETIQRIQESSQNGQPELLVVLFKVIFLAAVFALAGYIIWRAYRRLRRPLRLDSDELHETVQHEGSLGDDLGALMRGLLGRFRRSAPPPEPDLPPDLLAVRRLYLRALEKSAAEGSPRPPASTPAEFAPTLAGTLHTPAAERLSEHFAAARYGRLATHQPELSELEREIR